MLKNISKYSGYTLMEILIVMSILVILGGLGFAAFGGLRDTVLVDQSLTDIKQDIQDVQRASMLLQKGPNEGWVYGIGIDFSKITDNGKYSFFKWCAPFESFGDEKTRSDLLDYDYSQGPVGSGNGYLPVGNIGLSSCDGTQSGLSPLPGYEIKSVTAGFDMRITPVQYIVFEAITGRAFLYYSDGQPAGYNLADGVYTGLDLVENPAVLGLIVSKNNGKLQDLVFVLPLSGNAIRTTGSNLVLPEQSEQELTTTEPSNDYFYDEVLVKCFYTVGGDWVCLDKPRVY